MLDRRDFVARLLVDRGDLLVVTGLGSPTYDVTACGDHPLNFYLWSAMGSAAMVGLGLALARPDRRVAVITGDGEMLMGIGSLATIGVKQPGNLALVVLDNRHYGATGMQPSHTQAGIDLVAIAAGCRFRHAALVSEQEGAAEVQHLLHSAAGPIFIQARVAADDHPRILPSRDGPLIKHRFMQAAG
jgi:thiamine pyrophosphate-dependent acetolactate synthase large subunit-like protein